MGMFDYIKFEVNCLHCGSPMTDWQSKDEICELKLLPVHKVNNFYCDCRQCNRWYEFSRSPVSHSSLGAEWNVVISEPPNYHSSLQMSILDFPELVDAFKEAMLYVG